jgi:tRNA U34 5-methylaminomethyl-2-thiouridine-forming methyltransferase MnmC
MCQIYRPMADYRPPNDFVLTRTGDGSNTLRSEQLDDHYHSLHGAVQESWHVYIANGLRASDKKALNVLEVGLGTGLNMLLTWVQCIEGKCRVDYTALEPFPLPREVIKALDHPGQLAVPTLEREFLKAMAHNGAEPFEGKGWFTFVQRATRAQALLEENAFDVIYFDAFSPKKQPELWTEQVFVRMFEALVPGGILTTYTAQGTVRRAMEQAGFVVERLAGPPGKRHMLRGRKPM